MAKTFYQYGERDAIQYTDWSEISKNFSTMISDELTRREEKKAEIQKATDEAMKFINDNPVGAYSLANDFSLAHAKNAQEYLLMLDKKLKSGALNPKDFVMMRENLKTGTEGIYKVAKAYQERFKEVDEDLNSGDPQLSNLTYARMIALEGLGRLENTDALIDVASGRVNLSKYDVVDGIKNYTEGYTTNEAMAFMQTDIKRFKVRDQVQIAVNSLGKLKEAYFEEAARYGGFNVLTEKVNMQDESELKGVKEGYQKWREDTINSFMNDTHQASILVDFLEGEGYKAVTNRSEFNNDKTGKLLYIAPNGEVEFQEGQKERARDAFATQLDSAIDKEYREKGAGYRQYPPGYGDGGGTGKGLNANDVMTNAGLLYYGNQSQMDSATEYFRSAIPSLQKIDRKADTLTLTFTTGATLDFDISDKDNVQDFVRGFISTANLGDKVKGTLNYQNLDMTLPQSRLTSTREIKVPTTKTEQVNNYIASAISGFDLERSGTGADDKGIADLRAIVSALGFTVKDKSPVRDNKIVLVSPTNVELPINLKSSNPGSERNNIINFIQANTTKKVIDDFVVPQLSTPPPDEPAEKGEMLSYNQWLAQNPNGTGDEYTTYVQNFLAGN